MAMSFKEKTSRFHNKLRAFRYIVTRKDFMLLSRGVVVAAFSNHDLADYERMFAKVVDGIPNEAKLPSRKNTKKGSKKGVSGFDEALARIRDMEK